MTIGAAQRRRGGQTTEQLRREVGGLVASRLGDRVIARVGIAGIEIQALVRGQGARAVEAVAMAFETDFLLQRIARIGGARTHRVAGEIDAGGAGEAITGTRAVRIVARHSLDRAPRRLLRVHHRVMENLGAVDALQKIGANV